MPGPKEEGLQFGPIGTSAIHLCVDMQRMFAEPTPWKTPWMNRILPSVLRLAEAAPESICFTRFIPLERADQGAGTWRRYYERWPAMTLEALDPELVELVGPLRQFTPPAAVFDKRVYNPWTSTDLHQRLQIAGKDTLVITGGETEVCVLATTLGAVDLGYRVVLATDAICSSADETHDAMMEIYHSRFGMQVETAKVDEIVDAWNV